jgi:hypothetical protein
METVERRATSSGDGAAAGASTSAPIVAGNPAASTIQDERVLLARVARELTGATAIGKSRTIH